MNSTVIVFWAFLVGVGFSDGSKTVWPSPQFNTEAECVEWRNNLAAWFTEHSASLNVVAADWKEAECKAFSLQYNFDSSPLPGGEKHGHLGRTKRVFESVFRQ